MGVLAFMDSVPKNITDKHMLEIIQLIDNDATFNRTTIGAECHFTCASRALRAIRILDNFEVNEEKIHIHVDSNNEEVRKVFIEMEVSDNSEDVIKKDLLVSKMIYAVVNNFAKCKELPEKDHKRSTKRRRSTSRSPPLSKKQTSQYTYNPSQTQMSHSQHAHLPAKYRFRSPERLLSSSPENHIPDKQRLRYSKKHRFRSPTSNSIQQNRSQSPKKKRSKSPIYYNRMYSSPNRKVSDHSACDGESTPGFEREMVRFNNYTEEWNKEKKLHKQEWDAFHEFPEQHPNYSKEWEAFWMARSKELNKQKKDVKNYDFTAEWEQIWSVREKELELRDLKARKQAIFSKHNYSRSPSPPERIIKLKYNVKTVKPTKKKRKKRKKNTVCIQREFPKDGSLKQSDCQSSDENLSSNVITVKSKGNDWHENVKLDPVQACFRCVNQLCKPKVVDMLKGSATIVQELKKESDLMEVEEKGSSIHLFSDKRILSGLNNLKSTLMTVLMSGLYRQDAESLHEGTKAVESIVEMVKLFS